MHLLKDQPFLDFRKITAYISRTSYTKSFKTIAERVQNELQVQQGNITRDKSKVWGNRFFYWEHLTLKHTVVLDWRLLEAFHEAVHLIVL